MNSSTDFNWRGPWSGMQAYKVGNAVSFQSSSFIALDDIAAPGEGGPGNPPPNNNAAWDVLCRGIRWNAGWQKQSTYKALDVVAYQGSSYIAVQDVPDNIEISNEAYWNVIASIGEVGLNWRGDWSDEVAYSRDDAVRFNTNSYIAIKESPAGVKPTDIEYWQPMSDELDKAALDTASLIISSTAAAGSLASAIASFLGFAAVKTTAEGAAAAAAAAQTVADAAEGTAQNAQATANNAQATANDAQTTANNAQTTANDAQTTANDAQTTANDAQTTANDAQTTANDAQTTANDAQTTANDAQTTANDAQTTANDAQTTANDAQTTAGEAQKTTNESRVAILELNETIESLSREIKNLETIVLHFISQK